MYRQLIYCLPRAAIRMRNVTDGDSCYEHSNCSVSLFFRETGKIKTLFGFVSQPQKIFYMHPITSFNMWCGKHVQNCYTVCTATVAFRATSCLSKVLPCLSLGGPRCPCQWLSIKITPSCTLILFLFAKFILLTMLLYYTNCRSRKREIIQPNIYSLLPKVNQVIYTLDTIWMAISWS